MKTILRRTLSLLLAVGLTASLTVYAAASEALGEDLTAQNTTIHQATTLSTNVFWSTSYSDLRTENLVTYQPSTNVTPVVTYGSTLTSCNTVTSMARQLESQGKRVVAGINGDFYNTSTGLPIGLVISDGEVKSTDGGYYAIGFQSNGTAVLGRPTLTVDADLGYTMADSAGYATQVIRRITGINKARVSNGGIYLYTYDFNAKHTTGNTETGVDVVCTITDGSLKIGGKLTLSVESVQEVSTATAIPQGKVVLSANNLSNSYYTDALRNLPVGSTVTVSVSASDERWNDVQSAVGALYSLVENGAVVSGLPTGTSPRTAVGQKADGTLIFYTIDGRKSGYSIGASLTQVAQRLIELGCVTALCLDGGGSTTLAVTEPDATVSSTVNSPSGGSERSVSNQIFLVATNTPSGVLDHFYVSAEHPYVLAGSQVNISASAVDTHYIPMQTNYSLSSSAGTLSGSVLTTPAAGGTVTVTAAGGGRSGSTVVTAIQTPDSIAVRNGLSSITTLSMTPGSSAQLTASAIYQHLALHADAGAFTWSVEGGIGTIDANGKFTATTPGSGTIRVSAGSKSTTIPVTVSKIALSTLESFENTLPSYTAYGAQLTRDTAVETVRFGKASGKLGYSLMQDGTARLECYYTFSSIYTRLNLWVYGDNSGNRLSLLTSDGATITTTDLTVLDFVGWKQLSVTLPAGTTVLTGVQITGASEISIAEDGSEALTYPVSSGTLYLDQLVASYGQVVDSAVPTVTASVSGDAETGYTLSGTVSDAIDGKLTKSSISVTLDGKALDFTYDASSGKLTAVLSLAAGAAHRITISAQDASGNIGRASVDVDSYDVTHHFTDIQDYWASTYVDFLYTAGITTGYADGTFRPSKNITRQEFAVMLYRYLGLDGQLYTDVELPFADNAQIGEFAQTAIKALYTEGILNGSMKNGKLYFNPASNLTRAQAAAMIGRTQSKGYATAELTFTDAAAIPSYATYYVQTMVAQGIIGGYADGTFQPNTNISRGQMAKILYNLL